MRSQNHIIQPEERRVGRRGLLLVDIETRTGNSFIFQRVAQGLILDNWTAGCIDNNCGLFHKPELPFTNEALGIRCQIAVYMDEVGFPQKILKGNATRPKTLLNCMVLHTIVIENCHIKTLRPFGNL